MPDRVHVLVVEDEPLVRMAVSEYLRDAGYRVAEACDAAEAMAILGKVAVDLVFTDVDMPGEVDGLGLAAWVRENRPGTALAITSGVPRVTENARDLALGAPFFDKPYNYRLLERRIGAMVGTRADAVRPEGG